MTERKEKCVVFLSHTFHSHISHRIGNIIYFEMMATPTIDMADKHTGVNASTSATTQLCSSCERCRTRKTKCDGKRPCGNCAARYKKINKCEDIDGVDFACFDCIYSLAKRRGPVPGRNINRHLIDNIGIYSTSPDNLPCPVESEGNGVMGGLGWMGYPNGMIPLGLNEFSDTVPTKGVAEGEFGDFDLPSMKERMHAMLARETGNHNMDFFSPAVEVGRGFTNANMPNFSLEELNQLLEFQQQTMKGLFGDLLQQQQQQQERRQRQLHSNSIHGVGPIFGTIGKTNFDGVTKKTGNIFPAVVTSAGGTLKGCDLHRMNLARLSFQGLPGEVNPHHQQQLEEQRQSQMLINHQSTMYQHSHDDYNDRSPKRSNHAQPATESFPNTTSTNSNVVHISIAKHISLLQPSSTDGALLRSIYELSTNTVLNLPPMVTDEDYFARLSLPPGSNHNEPNELPSFDQNAFRAARFAELSLGALANEQVSLAMELSNASVICLRDCVDKPAHTSCLYDVTRAYLLLGIFRSFRGDMLRYFKYRRVCLRQISKLDFQLPVEALLAAISFHDAWVYIMHNGSVDSLPNIDEFLPPLRNKNMNHSNSISASSIATNPINQMWMQGSPPVFLNNEANLISRSIDAFSCAVRTCCDHANTNFDDIAKASGIGSPTYSAVLANEKELCSRNILMSAKIFLDQSSLNSMTTTKKHGLYFVSHAMSAFVENSQSDHLQEGSGDGESNLGRFTPVQIKNLFAACEIIIRHPMLLHSPGPLYHMASNAAVMMCHLLNAIYSKYKYDVSEQKKDDNDGMTLPINMTDSILFDDALDTFQTMRTLLNIHRKTLPVKLRCHALPRPSRLGPFKRIVETGERIDVDPPAEDFFIDLGETLMCLCRGCQGFVFMGCSPCVAAERIANAAHSKDRQNIADDFSKFQENSDIDDEPLEHRKGQGEFNNNEEYSNDDLLGILSQIMKD
ncbi:hypothetical protein ACHAXA_009454 [Cyclostephanos tholiformis]|uniref:Zn(2)-C6 fungal-type domain-containing protein n=1 Tax=Cyclostephanos tholiformis TaxID=382380 RepID=A0ABD3RHT3_9STRA